MWWGKHRAWLTTALDRMRGHVRTLPLQPAPATPEALAIALVLK
jgi:hypothetical protein